MGAQREGSALNLERGFISLFRPRVESPKSRRKRALACGIVYGWRPPVISPRSRLQRLRQPEAAERVIARITWQRTLELIAEEDRALDAIKAPIGGVHA